MVFLAGLCRCPGQVKAGGFIEIHSSRAIFIPWVEPAVRGVGGPDGVRSSGLHEASCSEHFQTCGPILRLATLPRQTPAATCHTPKPHWIFLHQPIETRERKIGQPDMVAGKFPRPHRVNYYYTSYYTYIFITFLLIQPPLLLSSIISIHYTTLHPTTYFLHHFKHYIIIFQSIIFKTLLFLLFFSSFNLHSYYLHPLYSINP